MLKTNRILPLLICLFASILLSLAQANDNEQQLWHLYAEYVNDETLKNTPEIRASKLLLLAENQRVLVDVREKYETQVSMIPGALSQQQFEQNIEKYQNAIVIVYCTIGYRSGRYVNSLLKKNIDAYNLAGGVLAWAYAGQLFSHNGQVSKQVHVYGEQWNLLPMGYEAVYEKSWFNTIFNSLVTN